MPRKLLLLAGLLCAAGAAFAQPQYIWQLQELARAPGETLELRDERGRILKRLQTQQLLYLYSVAQAIQDAAETQAVLLLVDGDQPNAFATIAKARPRAPGDAAGQGSATGQKLDEDLENDPNAVEVNIVAVNFAMLDMLERDVHMMAALFGHELAHLKLNHREDQEKHGRTARSIANASTTRYSRDNEREADYLGAVWAVEAGYDPQGAVRLQEMVYQHSRFRGSGFSGSHPSSTERIAILQSLARRLSASR